MTQLLDLRNTESGDWELYETTPHYRRWIMHLKGDQYVMKTEFLGDDELVEQNRQDYNDSIGKRWGDGQVVARIPLNKLFDPREQIVENLQQGDRDHLKWWLNSEAALPYRTFKGRV